MYFFLYTSLCLSFFQCLTLSWSFYSLHICFTLYDVFDSLIEYKFLQRPQSTGWLTGRIIYCTWFQLTANRRRAYRRCCSPFVIMCQIRTWRWRWCHQRDMNWALVRLPSDVANQVRSMARRSCFPSLSSSCQTSLSWSLSTTSGSWNDARWWAGSRSVRVTLPNAIQRTCAASLELFWRDDAWNPAEKDHVFWSHRK